MGGGKTPEPSAESTALTAAQLKATEAEEKRLATQEAADKAAKKARMGRNGGRALLLDDELGVTDATGTLQTTTGS